MLLRSRLVLLNRPYLSIGGSEELGDFVTKNANLFMPLIPRLRQDVAHGVKAKSALEPIPISDRQISRHNNGFWVLKWPDLTIQLPFRR